MKNHEKQSCRISQRLLFADEVMFIYNIRCLYDHLLKFQIRFINKS